MKAAVPACLSVSHRINRPIVKWYNSPIKSIADKVMKRCYWYQKKNSLAAICKKLLATAISLLQSAGSFWQLPFLCCNLQEVFGSCHFFAAICRKLLAVAKTLPQSAGSFWQLPKRCRILQGAFDSCQNVAAICRKLLTFVKTLPHFAGSF